MSESVPSIALAQEAYDFFDKLRNNYKEDNLNTLKTLRERMVMHGFDAPLKALLQKTYYEMQEEDEESYADLKKQINYFRQMAILKKGALRRADISIASHMLAKSFLKMGYGDIVEFLALDGNHINFLFKSGVNGVRTYKEIMDAFEKREETIPVYIIEVFFKGERYKVKVKNKEETEEKVYREFGPDAQIMNVKIGKKDYPLIKSKAIRTVLISAIVSYLSKDEEDKNELKKKAIGLLLAPIFRFYMINSSEERKKNNLYYSLTNVPKKDQIKLFDLLGEIDPELKNAGKILQEKLKLEKEINIQSKLIGAGVLARNLKKENKWIAEYLKISEEDVEKGKEYLEAYSKKGKGAEFLEHLK